MLDKFKQVKQLKELQRELQKEKTEIEKRGIKVVVNGKMEVEKIELDMELSKEEQEETLLSCLNEAMQKMQLTAARKMQQMGGF